MKNLPRRAILVDRHVALEIDPSNGAVDLELFGTSGGTWMPTGGPWKLSPALARRIGRRLFAAAEAAAEWRRAKRILRKPPG